MTNGNGSKYLGVIHEEVTRKNVQKQFEHCQEAVEKLASLMGVEIPDGIMIQFWPLPIVGELFNRTQIINKRLGELERKADK